MKIFCIGLPKTGTHSILRALNLLGFKTKHYSKHIYKDIKKGYNTFAENECVYKYKELYKKFPFAKFIMTTRELDKWLLSIKNHFENKNPHPKNSTKKIRKRTLGTWNYQRDLLIDKYKSHHTHVRSFFGNNDNFIEFKIGNDGWKKLCDFLQKDIPQQSFPHKNKGIYK